MDKRKGLAGTDVQQNNLDNVSWIKGIKGARVSLAGTTVARTIYKKDVYSCKSIEGTIYCIASTIYCTKL